MYDIILWVSFACLLDFCFNINNILVIYDLILSTRKYFGN